MQPVLHQYEQNGTVFGAINKKQFETLTVVSPTSQLVTAFESFVFPLEQRLRDSVANARTLAAQQDALLPKLVSGELRVGGLP